MHASLLKWPGYTYKFWWRRPHCVQYKINMYWHALKCISIYIATAIITHPMTVNFCYLYSFIIIVYIHIWKCWDAMLWEDDLFSGVHSHMLKTSLVMYLCLNSLGELSENETVHQCLAFYSTDFPNIPLVFAPFIPPIVYSLWIKPLGDGTGASAFNTKNLLESSPAGLNPLQDGD